MSEQINQYTANKPGAKRTTQSRHAKPVNKISSQKRALMIGPGNAGKGSALQSNPELTFSYESADDKTVLDIIDLIRTGISFDEFEKIVDSSSFSIAEWANYLQLSQRTIQRNQKERKHFQPIHSERIIELDMLYKYGVEVFGDKENFDVWLDSKSIALGGRTPKELLDTKFGVDMVKDELGRIEHGVLA